MNRQFDVEMIYFIDIICTLFPPLTRVSGTTKTAHGAIHLIHKYFKFISSLCKIFSRVNRGITILYVVHRKGLQILLT